MSTSLSLEDSGRHLLQVTSTAVSRWKTFALKVMYFTTCVDGETCH